MNPNELIRVILPRKGEILLLPRDHLATGGEGAVYLKDGLVFKLYLDSAGARARGMEEKIRLLSKIRHPSIVAPIDIVCDRQHRMVGFCMEAAPGVPLVKTFTFQAGGHGSQNAGQRLRIRQQSETKRSGAGFFRDSQTSCGLV
ncbi:MAG: hypothetical protein P4L55_00165 [Syntrophobacteraceae bacterium]|nr:hypothetical protein [Syntrophobacteraceae bacterium]